MEFRERMFLVLAAIFLTSLVMANIIGITKFVTVFGLTIPVGMIAYPITFLATDLISEFYGRRRASFLVWVGLGMNAFMLLIMTIGFYASPDAIWSEGILKGDNPDAVNTYATVYGYMVRGTIASMIAYLIAQLTDVHLFHFWKELTGGKHLWLRNNGSTMISQILDTIAVISITLYPTHSFGDIVSIIISGYLFKFFVALVDTPLFYAGVRLLKGRLAVPESPVKY